MQHLRVPALPLAVALALPLGACGRNEPPGIQSERAAAAQSTAQRPAGAAGVAPVGAAAGVRPGAAAAGETWNAEQIDWKPYETGVAQARMQNKPVCLVFYTTWCPHCRNFSHIFDDPSVVEKARSFVMVRANADEEGELAHQYELDGGYIPRTFFLSPDGHLDPRIHAPRPKFIYFYDEKSPASLLAGMNEALQKLLK